MNEGLGVRDGQKSASSVQSVERAFTLLEAIADSAGVAGVAELTETSGLPAPTIHRILRTLVKIGYLRQEPSREYALGPRLVRLGDAAGQLLESWANPHVKRVADFLGESANFALMDRNGMEVVYVASAPGRHGMRMFTEVGQRAGLHCTAVGKAILAARPAEETEKLVNGLKLYAHTHNTITSATELLRDLDETRQRGYATDNEEREVGVCCVAVAVPGSPTRGALSISGPVTRMTQDVIESAVPLLNKTAGELATRLDQMAR